MRHAAENCSLLQFGLDRCFPGLCASQTNRDIEISFNSLSGSIPDAIAGLSGTLKWVNTRRCLSVLACRDCARGLAFAPHRFLDLRVNNLSGSIPAGFCKLLLLVYVCLA